MIRFLHRCYAWMFGYFWLPCPACGKYFGGHESPIGAGIIKDGIGFMVCKSCAPAHPLSHIYTSTTP